ncbi:MULTISPECIES: sulfatase [unclassified Carboxylicivirga]|uniref:sulfatase n=1 Tax=Carboxylicivirga TaxID=1628153 RepID=UPI003D34EF2F
MKWLSGIIIFLSLFLIACQSSYDKTSPNVIMILVDDMGWTDLACYGSDYHQTPNIDQLASEGTLFTNSYSSCNVCSPTRAALMTGKNPARLHLTDWIEGHKYPWAKLKVPEWKMYLDAKEYTLAEAFKDAGYYTAHIGKWHLGETEKDWPEHHGFDVNIAGWSKGAPNRNAKNGSKGYFSPYGNPRLNDGEEGEYLTERLTDQVCKVIQEQKNKPFFINFWLYNVHMPLQAKENKIQKYVALSDSAKNHYNPKYAAMVEHSDDAVGKVVAQLKESGLFENTIILLASDNGGLIGKGKRKITSNAPLRHGKGGIYEGGIRIPTILYAPTINKANDIIHEPVITEDYYPTLFELAGIHLADKNVALDGQSWLPLLEGEQTLKRDAIHWHYPHYHQEGAVPHSAIRQGKWKLIENLETNSFELYNLEEDLGEKNDLHRQYPDILSELKNNLDIWRKDVNAQMPKNNPEFEPIKERKKNKRIVND